MDVGGEMAKRNFVHLLEPRPRTGTSRSAALPASKRARVSAAVAGLGVEKY